MEGTRPPHLVHPDFRPPGHPLWVVGLVGLIVVQGFLTLQLLGAAGPFTPLLDDQPVVSGRHPLHQYHGYLGARALIQQGGMSCYDPTFHAGYPKTPVFDSGSRPAELLSLLAQGEFHPSAYKLGLALFCTSVPVVFWFAARGLRLPRGPSWLAALLGVVVFWQPPCQALLRTGNIDLLLAGLLVLGQAGGLLRYHDDPGPVCWSGVVLAGFLAWFAHPVLLVVLLPPALIYYFQVGPSHRGVWHGFLVVGLLSAIAANTFWLSDWIGYWWLRVPLRLDRFSSAESLLPALWFAPIWGDLLHRGMALSLLGFAVLGLVLLVRRNQLPGATLYGIYLLELVLLAGLGVVSSFFAAVDISRVFVLALFFAVPLSVFTLHACLRGGALLVIVPVIALLPIPMPYGLGPAITPLQIGFDAEQQAIVQAIKKETTQKARILWEDETADLDRWTALLSLVTDRAFIGGLDPDPEIEHLTNGLTDQVLGSRPLREWADSSLSEYCDRYNVGWIFARTAASKKRLESWPLARLVTRLPLHGEEGHLYAIDRRFSFTLVGHADLLHADDQRIVLGNVRPWQGRVVLSLHHIAGLKASPSRVIVEPEIDPLDAIPRVRLRIDEPVARVTLTWSRR